MSDKPTKKNPFELLARSIRSKVQKPKEATLSAEEALADQLIACHNTLSTLVSKEQAKGLQSKRLSTLLLMEWHLERIVLEADTFVEENYGK